MLDLEKRFLSDEDAEELYRQYPTLRPDYRSYCPTCLLKNDRKYVWKGKTVRCDCQKQLQLHKHYLNAGIGVNFQRLSWDDYEGDPSLKEDIDLYLSSHEEMVARGVGMILTGEWGVGKTMAMNLMMKDLLKLGHSVYATTFSSMIDMFTAGWRSQEDKQKFESRVRMSQVLLIDDLGKEYKTKTGLAESTFDSVLRSRVQGGRPTFITTNMSTKEMESGYGSAIMSLFAEAAMIREVKGADFRKRVVQRTMKEVASGETRPIV